ncbi:hypothetical protein D3273_20465 [Lichenibacterium minor]|uniref:AAA domain-containing protein n=1 Tax=Lichenibacterium minor TaxID=2316528 RepID=A0A4Q2U221_9HYPH|nr:hypothetical protein [Lichenibacterium minor]RYC30160.1 hypothetical protein D3273_20465 [Lichenibacterium minor]
MQGLKYVDFGRYRSFDQMQVMELRPLTLLFGHNSAGKSAALRLLPILASAARQQIDGIIIPTVLDYSSPALRGASFNDLVNQHYKGSFLEFGIGWGGQSYKMRIKSGTAAEGEFLSDFQFVSGEKRFAGHPAGEGHINQLAVSLNDGLQGEITVRSRGLRLSVDENSPTAIVNQFDALNRLLVL